MVEAAEMLGPSSHFPFTGAVQWIEDLMPGQEQRVLAWGQGPSEVAGHTREETRVCCPEERLRLTHPDYFQSSNSTSKRD